MRTPSTEIAERIIQLYHSEPYPLTAVEMAITEAIETERQHQAKLEAEIDRLNAIFNDKGEK